MKLKMIKISAWRAHFVELLEWNGDKFKNSSQFVNKNVEFLITSAEIKKIHSEGKNG